jgi:hypothetical protein
METTPSTRSNKRLAIRMGLLASLVIGSTLAPTRLHAGTGPPRAGFALSRFLYSYCSNNQGAC